MTEHIHVTTDGAHKVKRRLAYQYDNTGVFKANSAVGTLTNAMSGTNPNSQVTSGTNPVGRGVAMGMIPESGLVSFIHNGSAATDMTFLYWDEMYANLNGGKGWVLGAETAGLNTKALVLPGALCTFKGPVGAPWYLQVGVQSQPTECLVHDGGPDDPSNLNTFGSPNNARATVA